jgi:two-component system sensor histidine kinase ChvG
MRAEPSKGSAANGGVPLPLRIPRLRSLRFRSLAVVVLSLLLPIGLLALLARQDRHVAESMRANLHVAARAAADALSRGADGDVDAIARRHDVRIRVLDRKGSVGLDADHEQGTRLFQRIGALMFGDDGAPTLREADEQLGPLGDRAEVRAGWAAGRALDCAPAAGDRLLVCTAMELAGGRLVHAQESSRRSARALHDLRYELVRLTIVLLPVALLLAWWLGWRTVRPIEQLRRQVLAQAARATPEGEIALARRDEIGDLARSFNTLLHALEARRAANEAFVADLVHELKNPIAAIRACADAIEHGQVDEARGARLSRVLRDSTRRLDGLATSFLELARAEAGMPNEAREALDLVELARATTSAAHGDERWRDKRIDVRADGPLRVHGVPGRLEAVVRNLVENALSFAATRVEITVEGDDSMASLAVTDDGPGLAPDVAPRVFDRFFTTRDRSRDSGSGGSAGSGGSGTGLGLALARAIVEAHGGTLVAENAQDGGARFVVRIPR